MIDRNDFNDSNVVNEQTVLLNDEGNRKTLKLCIFFGPRVPYIHVKSVYLLLIIIGLEKFYFYNTTSILQSLLSYYYKVFANNKYLFGVLTNLFFIFSPIFGYIADRRHWNRTRIVLSSLILGIVASLFILATLIIQYTSQKQDTYGFVNKHNYTCTALHTNSSSNLTAIAECYIVHVCIIIGLLFFSLHYAIFFPYSIVYGLDLLEGTPQASYCLFFPMVYIAINIGSTFEYLNYFSFDPSFYPFHFCLFFVALIIAFLLFILGMCFKIFSESDRIHNHYSFSVSIKIIWRAIKIRRYGRPKAKVNILYLAATGLNPYSRADVERTIHLFGLNLILFLILPLLIVYQAMGSLFTQQDDILRSEFYPLPENTSIHPSDDSYYCKPFDFIISYIFANDLVAVIFTISMEYFYYKITFGYKPNMVFFLKCLKKDSKFRFTKIKQMLHRYFHYIDPIRKKLFFSFPFGLLTLFFGLAVDRVSQRKHNIFPITCNNSVGSYSLSQIPLSAQIPQYVFAAMMEAIFYIYMYQYIMYVCAKYFQNSMRAFFISLYSFYFGLAGIVINSINALLANQCDHPTCSHCYIYTDKCYSKTSINRVTNTWIIWAIMLVLLSINMVAFFLLIHYKYIKNCCRRDRKSVTSEPDLTIMNSSDDNYRSDRLRTIPH